MVKVAVVTGASSGIGLACVQQLLLAGYAVAGFSRRGSGATECLNLSVDVSDENAVQQAMQIVQEQLGTPQIVVCAAGNLHTGLVAWQKNSDFLDVYKVHVGGAKNTAKAALKYMLREKRGQIIFVGSKLPDFPGVGSAAYVCAKLALRGIAQVLSLELQRTSISVSLVELGLVDTVLIADMPLKERQRLEQLTPPLSAKQASQVVIKVIEK